MRLLIIALVAGCASRSTTSSSPKQPPIDPAMCTRLATSQHQHCGRDQPRALEQCMAYARLTEAAACGAAAQRAFDCALKVADSCQGLGCCDRRAVECDEGNLSFDHCMLGYCSGQPGNPDCAWLGPAMPAPGTPAPKG